MIARPYQTDAVESVEIPKKKLKRQAYNRAYHAKNRQKHNERAREYGKANRERSRELSKLWRAKNPEKCKAIRLANKEKRKAQFKAWYAKNKELAKTRSKEWGDANKARIRHRRILRQYSLTEAGWKQILTAQGGLCAICKTDTPTKLGWSVDHCHIKNKVRGLLCNKCNTGLGNFSDNASALRAAADYLEASCG